MSEGIEYVRCNLCGNDDTRPFLKLDECSYQRCLRCGLVYQNPRPGFSELKGRYGSNYFVYELNNQNNFFNLMKLGLKDIGFDTLFQQNNGERRFLDIGCATGLLLNHMKGRGWDCYGVEICSESVSYAKQHFGLNIYNGTLKDASFPEHFFNVVHLSHLIEHVTDPAELLLEIRRIVKQGHHVILTTPNVAGMQAVWAGEKWRSAIPDHLYLFSRKTMGDLLKKTGFTVVKQVSWGGIPAGKRPGFIKKPADRFAKLFNIGDVMLFHCRAR